MLLDETAIDPIVQLKWGRALMSAEIAERWRRAQHRRHASMGPRPDERGNMSEMRLS